MKSDEAKINTIQQPSHTLRGFFLLLLAVFFWGSAAPVGKYLIVSRFDTLIIVQTRTTLAFLLMFIFFIIKDRKIFIVRYNDIWKIALLGIIGVAVTNFTYYFTVKEASVATAILVQYSAPVWIMLFSVFILKEDTLDRVTVISLVIALTGCFFAVTSGSFESINLKGWAVITGPLSAFTFAYQVIGTKQMIKRYSIWTLLLYMFGFSAIFWLCINPPSNIIAKNYSGSDWGILWMFAIISILIPQIAFAGGLKYLDASTAGIISVMEPVIAIVAAYLILGESISLIQSYGAFMVVIAVIMLQVHPAIMKKMIKIE